MSSVPLARFAAAAAALFLLPAPVAAHPAATVAPAPTYRYADVADLALKAPLVIDATVRDAARIKGAEAAGVAPGFARFYVTVDVAALIRGPGAMPVRLGYLYDAKLNSDGEPPKLRKGRFLLFARPLAATPDEIQLVANRGMLAWSPATDAQVRRIVRDVAAPDAPPAIVGIANAFHAAGSLPGEGETQIFLKTAGHPISLGITRKQDATPVWTVSLSEVVDAALPPPQRDTFLWYRLACGLPRAIPDDILAGLDAADSAAVRDDYALVLSGLGPCRN
jgi:hypothetical protein